MIRNIDMDEVSDGKRYTSNDMVRLGCDDCKGCSSCCRGMGETIVLDPFDVYMLTVGLKCTFDSLLDKEIELNIADGIILPNLKMAGSSQKCSFLDESGRCSIHEFRPGICRLFPLGRIYGENDFKYFLQVNECKKSNRTKVKVSQWLGVPQLKTYEKYISDWHFFLKELQGEIKEMQDQAKITQISLNLLLLFFRKPYDNKRDFYSQFYERMKMIT